MPKSIALWLKRHTKLSIGQIAHFTGLSILELHILKVKEFNPIKHNILTQEEIIYAENNPDTYLDLKVTTKSTRVVLSNSQKKNKKNVINWFMTNKIYISDEDLQKLLHSSTNAFQRYKLEVINNSSEYTPISPISLGFCDQNFIDRYL